MSSLYDELTEKMKKNEKRTKPGVAQFDLSLLLFNMRESLNALWQTADLYLQAPNEETQADLQTAIEQLRPIFGDRDDSKQVQ